MKKISGVYSIQSELYPERVYIGSSIDIFKRWREHELGLLHRRHHSHQLQRHYDKYGLSDLIFEIIESGKYICKEHLLSREQGWYGHFRYRNEEIPYFNNCLIAGSNAGVVVSEETREKQRLAKLGKKRGPNSPEHNRNIGNGNRGKTPSDETLLKLSESHKGYKMPEEQKRKISESLKGKKRPLSAILITAEKKRGTHHTEETKKKLSEKLKGRKIKEESIYERTDEIKKQISETLIAKYKEHPEWVEKIRSNQRGRKHTEETILNMKIAQRKRREKERMDKQNE